MGNEVTTEDRSSLAAILSFVVPGAGQVYTGHFIWAIFWLIFTPGFWIGTGGCLGLLCHILAAWQAHGQGSR
jgi:TM2 domain-containing membrane protein YozV